MRPTNSFLRLLVLVSFVGVTVAPLGACKRDQPVAPPAPEGPWATAQALLERSGQTVSPAKLVLKPDTLSEIGAKDFHPFLHAEPRTLAYVLEFPDFATAREQEGKVAAWAAKHGLVHNATTAPNDVFVLVVGTETAEKPSEAAEKSLRLFASKFAAED